MIIRHYEGLQYTDINAVQNSEDIEGVQLTSVYVRISVLSGSGRALEEKGCRMMDRTLEVKIPLQKTGIDYEKKIRMSIEKKNWDRKELFSLAERNFKDDSRFYITGKAQRKEIANEILKIWIEEIKEPFVCIYQDKLIGFADVRYLDEYKENPFVYLAAVDEKYRLTGAAVSLYASICAYYKACGKQYLYGRISSKNTAVMNLYASLGGQFLNPWDIFIK